MKKTIFSLMFVSIVSIFLVQNTIADDCRGNSNNQRRYSNSNHRPVCSVCGLAHTGVCVVTGTVRAIGGATVDAVATTVDIVGDSVARVGDFIGRTGRRIRHVGNHFDCRR